MNKIWLKERFKDLSFSFLFPPSIVAALIIPLAALMMLFSLTAEKITISFLIVSLVLFAYAVGIASIRIFILRKKAHTIAQNNKYAALYLADEALRAKISLYIAFTINVSYVALQLYLGIVNGSIWFYALAVYYIGLSTIRLILLMQTRHGRLGENMEREFRDYRYCGAALLLLSFVVAVLSFYIIWQNRGFSYHYLVTLAIATHTFVTLIKSIISIINQKKNRSPVLAATKQVRIVACLVSLFSLESALLDSFGDGDAIFNRMMISTTAVVVFIIVLCIAIYMICRGTRELRKKEERAEANVR